MTLFIAPTQSCNFDCIYCFENERQKKTLNSKKIIKLIEFISTFKSSNIKIVWYGGEPLLAFNKIEEISRKLVEKKVSFNSTIITNGSLIKEKYVDTFDNMHIDEIQITLDGLKETHDKRRFYIKSNKGTFDDIIKNIETIFNRNKRVTVNIRVNIDDTNKDDYILLSKLLYTKFKNNKLYIGPAFVYEKQGACSSIINCIKNREEKMRFYQNLSNNNKYYVNYYPSITNGVCMARHINSYVIDADCNLYKCPWDIGVNDKIIGNFNIKEKVNNKLLRDYLIGEDHLDDKECKDCFYLPICGGGCVNLRLLSRIDNNSNYCIFMKNYIDQYIKMFLVSNFKKNKK